MRQSIAFSTRKSITLRGVNQSRFQRVNQSSHGAGNNSRNSCRISHIPKINRHKIKHSASPAPLTDERAKVIVFLVDTHVEIEKGFSPSESATSQNLSRYTLRSVQDRNPARPDAGRERSNTCPPWRASEGSLGLKKGGLSRIVTTIREEAKGRQAEATALHRNLRKRTTQPALQRPAECR
jgi:hypothetical protein